MSGAVEVEVEVGGELEVGIELLVDARGHRCPVPTLRLRRALEAARPGQAVVLLADDPLARIDVPHFVSQAGQHLCEVGERGPGLRFVVRKSPLADGAAHGPPPGSE